MISKSMSYIEILRRAQDLHQILEGFTGYTPPREEESIDGFQAFINQIINGNQNVIIKAQDYQNWRDQRYNTFFVGNNSIKNLFYAIRSVVSSQYGVNSIELILIERVIDNMRYTKVVLQCFRKSGN
ncbi:MAG: hypothetical protein R2771_11385 [Saprospiraceae bacterium]